MLQKYQRVFSILLLAIVIGLAPGVVKAQAAAAEAEEMVEVLESAIEFFGLRARPVMPRTLEPQVGQIYRPPVLPRPITPPGPGPYGTKIPTWDIPPNWNLSDPRLKGLNLEDRFLPPSAEDLLSGTQIKHYQRILNSLGYNVGTPDGIIGKKTRDAISQLQKDNGYFSGLRLDPFYGGSSGNLDQRTQSLLNLVHDLTTIALRFLKLDTNSRDSIVDRSKLIKGYGEYSDGIDLYIEPRYDDTRRDFLKHFGPSNFGMLRLSVKGKRKSIQLLNEPAAAGVFDLYCRAFLKTYSTPEMRLITARRAETTVKGRRSFKYDVRTANQEFELTARDLAKLRKGQPLPIDHPLSKQLNTQGALVFWSNPLMKGAKGELNQVEALAFDIQQSYPEARVYRDDFLPGVTDKKVDALARFTVNGPDDLTVVLDDTSTITHWAIMEDLRHDFEAAHVQVIDYRPGLKWEGRRGKALIVITGHIDKAFFKLATQLIDDGYFKDNYVLFNACSGPLSTKLVARLNQEGGALGTFRFRGKINRPEIQELMLKVLDKLRESKPFNIHELSPANLDSRLKGIWVLCQNLVGGVADDRS
jgi:hypothetical protein